jgi:predicted molibdopterin-dependent oxidoreductase YjgC
MESPQFRRLAESDRPRIRLVIDGRSCEALAGDTLLTALLTNGRRLRSSEFGDGPRAGFCLMGACQDCWVALDDGTRLRACTSFVAEGMRIVTRSDVDMSAPGRPERGTAARLGGKARSAKGALK